ncbi:DUF885 domain-containing protein [Streptomyces sp. HD1123-B1]|uniref:DUF885 domain-containing protein n=1 Tax=Streptomyces huangiella TaxID=3228804 RepID=UPI003D7D95EE
MTALVPHTPATGSTPREVADRYVADVAVADPLIAQRVGLPTSREGFPDYSPDGLERSAELDRATLRKLDHAESGAGDDPAQRRCARLLRERVSTRLALHDAGEGLRRIGAVASPVQAVRGVFTQMPTGTDDDWAAVGTRLRHVATALEGYRAALRLGAERDMRGGPAQVDTVIGQLTGWTEGGGWLQDLASRAPDRLRPGLDAAAAAAATAAVDLRDWLRDDYGPRVRNAPDTVGRDRYALWVRHWTGSRADLDQTYAWGWEEIRRIEGLMRDAAEEVLPGATPRAALAHLSSHGTAVHGTDAVRTWLQTLMDETITALDGVHFNLPAPLRRVEAMIAPAGGAAAPYYTPPSLGFNRPGRTWLPVGGRDRFPVHELVSTWYHEGVPGHHVQLATRVLLTDRLSLYQATLGSVNADAEGWAMYAERLMDELGHFTDPALRLGHLDAQMMRAVRIVVDIGLHLGSRIPADAGSGHDGARWTPALAAEFLAGHIGRPGDFLDSELVRYLGLPGQAIGYKLGERAWREGRARAERRRGGRFDLKEWHTAALAQGPLGLDDLVDELERL